MIANNVQVLNKEVDFLFTSEDVKKIKKFANQKGGVRAIYRYMQAFSSVNRGFKRLIKSGKR